MVAKHKKGKTVRTTEEREVYDLFDRAKSVAAVVRETGISRSKIYGLRASWLAQAAARAEQPEQLSAIEKVALHLCQNGDHSWLTDPRFEWHGFTTTQEMEEYGHSKMKRQVLTCRFCDYEKRGKPHFWSVN